jgi:alpha-L-rhamnosidase
VLRTAFFADLLGKTKDAADYRKLAGKIRKSFLRKFAHVDGTFADKSLTATAAALYFGLVEERKAEKSVAALVKQVQDHQHKADFGILGAKYILRVLAEYGYADDALEILTQKEFPGWGWQVKHGATSLWENWNGKDSRNHIMFGDISAWMYQYLGGIRPQKETPGFRKFVIQPCFVKKLNRVKACHQSPYGMIRSEWKRQGGKILCEIDIPKGSHADIILPNQTIRNAKGYGNTIQL